ncbi:MAG: EAL domain-containing protein [Marinicellaceae bacterium]
MTKSYILILLFFKINLVSAQVKGDSTFEEMSIGLTHAPPLIVLSENKAPDGMLVDFLKSVASRENWKIKWITGTWSDVMAKAENGEVDIMTYIAFTEERAKIFNFSTQRFVTGWGQVYSKQDASINNILDLENKKIAVMRDDIHAKRFVKLCEEYSVNCQLIIAENYDQAFELLTEGQVEAAVSGSTVGISYEKDLNVFRTPIMFNPSNALFAMSKSKNSKPLTTIDEYLSKWRNDPKSPYSISQLKWIDVIHKNEIPKWVYYSIFLIVALLLLFLGISLILRKQIKKHVQQHINQSNQLKQIINLVPHLIYVVNADGKVVLVNRYASEHFGVTLLSNTTEHQLLQKVPQYRNLFVGDSELINKGEGLIQKELVTQNHAEDEVVFNIFKVPFDSTNKLPSVLTVGVDITSQKSYQKQIQYMALHDELTGLPNRQLLKANIIKSIKKFSKTQAQKAVLYIDLDFFKNINDSLGHAAGDKLLKVICKRLKSIANKKDMVARIGGDEFILHLSRFSSKSNSISQIKSIAKQVIAELSDKIEIDQQELYISASIGVVIYPKDASSYEQIMQRADIAMYQAKAKGRNNFVIFEEHMERVILKRHKLVADLRRALSNNEFSIEYQPQVFGNNQKVIGFEALIRWQHPSGKMIKPDDFIPAAEESGLIIPIGHWMLEQVCQQLHLWQEKHQEIPFVTVNLSVLQIHNDKLVESIDQLLSQYNIPAHLLELEVTETAMIKHIDKTISTISKLKDLGVRLSIDDFGTGYSSLSYLKKLPFDKLKIDYSFTRDILTDKETMTLVKTIIGMSQDLSLEVIAEGVESLQQLELLTELGCHHFQGYYFDSPKSADYIEEKYLTNKANAEKNNA